MARYEIELSDQDAEFLAFGFSTIVTAGPSHPITGDAITEGLGRMLAEFRALSKQRDVMETILRAQCLDKAVSVSDGQPSYNIEAMADNFMRHLLGG